MSKIIHCAYCEEQVPKDETVYNKSLNDRVCFECDDLLTKERDGK